MKVFEGADFDGEVLEVVHGEDDGEDAWLHVRYSDGDEEDLSVSEVRALCAKSGSNTAAVMSAEEQEEDDEVQVLDDKPGKSKSKSKSMSKRKCKSKSSTAAAAFEDLTEPKWKNPGRKSTSTTVRRLLLLVDEQARPRQAMSCPLRQISPCVFVCLFVWKRIRSVWNSQMCAVCLLCAGSRHGCRPTYLTR